MRFDRRARSELARKLYTDLVRGRSRVRLVQAPAEHHSSWPGAFILSPYRSGTTLLRYCLDSHPEFAVPPETDFLAPLAQLLRDEPALEGARDIGYPYPAWQQHVASFGRGPLDAYAASRELTKWVDKTPRYAEDPEGIASLFPDARFIILHRHPLDQIASFTRQGTFCHYSVGEDLSGEELIQAAATYWATVTARVVEFAQDGDAATITLTYEELCASPRPTLTRVAAHLSADFDEAMVNYHEHPHDVGREAGRVLGTRGFAPTTGRWREWPAEWQDVAWAIVDEQACALGYARG